VASDLRLPRQIWLLGGVSFFADISGEMIYPLLPLFIVSVLGASATDMGWIEGVATAMVAFASAWAGTRSDRLRRRVRWVRIGYALPVVGKVVLTAASAWSTVLLGRTVDRIGKGFRTSPRDALIADASSPATRGRAFGLHRSLDTAGALIGVLISAALLWWLTGTPSATADASRDAQPYRIIFAIAAAIGLVALALTWLVRDVAAPESVASKAESVPATLSLPGRYWRSLATLLVFALANSSDAFLLLRAHQVGLSAWAVVAAYAAYNVIYAALSYPAGALSDRIGRWWLIAIGWGIFAVAYALFAIADAVVIWPAFAIYGVYMALTEGVAKALIADCAPISHRGRALGILNLGMGIASILSSVAAGVLWDRVSHSAPFWLGTGGAIAALLLLVPRRSDFDRFGPPIHRRSHRYAPSRYRQ